MYKKKRRTFWSLWPPDEYNWRTWVVFAFLMVVIGLSMIDNGVLKDAVPASTGSGIQPITHCESVVTNAPTGRLTPPANAITISIYFSGEECQYIPQTALDFNQAYINGINPVTGQPLEANERPIFVTGRQMSSGTVFDGLVRELSGFASDDFVPPTIWSPSSSHFLAVLNEMVNREVFDLNDAAATALAPVVIAIWESRLDAIRSTVGYEDIGWEELLDVLRSSNGWCDYGIPDCRPAVYYGHTNPNFSPTGLSTLIAEYYASAYRNTDLANQALTLDQIRDEEIRAGVREIEQLIRHYSRRTTEFKHYIAQGPDYVDFVALEENDVITINRGLTEYTPPERLVALYPKEGIFWHEHPFAIPNAAWVSQEQRYAAQVFTDYVLTPDVQARIVSEGFRPANPSVPLGFPFDETNGVMIEVPTGFMPVPSGEVILAIKESWSFVKKQADIMLLVDVSGSMRGDKLALAQEAGIAFIDQVESIGVGNRVSLTTFNNDVDLKVPLGIVEINGDLMRESLNALNATGETALFAALTQVVNDMNQNDAEDRIRIVILLSDGQNASSAPVTLNDTIQAIEATSQSRNPVMVIPIAYGSQADISTLLRIAAASKTQLQNAGDPTAIEGILNIIASMS